MNMNQTNNEPLGRVMWANSYEPRVYETLSEFEHKYLAKPVLVLPWDAEGKNRLVRLLVGTILSEEVGQGAADQFLRALAPDEKGSK